MGREERGEKRGEERKGKERKGKERRGEENLYVSELEECRRSREEQMGGGQISCRDKAKNEELLSWVTLSQSASEVVLMA